MKSLEDKVSLIQSAKTKVEAFSHFNRLMLEYGYDSNVFTLLTDHPSIGERSTHGLAASYPQDWIDHYNERGFQAIDPVWQRHLRTTAPFFWADAVDAFKADNVLSEEQLKASLRMMDEAAEAGVADGIGISYLSPLGEMAAVGLSRRRAQRERRYEHMAEIYLLATFFHEKYMSFYDRPMARPVTPREREVLLWAAENKTDADISRTLNISAATVRFHWKNIFSKLGVNGRLPAVLRAIQLRLVTPQVIRAPYQGR